MPKFDVVSIGSATIDTIVKSSEFQVVKSNAFETGLAICEMYGSKTELDDFFVSSGGGATNSSCSLSHLGLKTSCISAIGNDVFSEFVYDDLTKYGVHTANLIVKKGEKTGFSVILTAPDGGRTVLVYRGSSEGLSVEDIKQKKFQTKWTYLTNLGADFENAIKVINYLKRNGSKVFWNPGIHELENAELDQFKKIDILSLNLEEAAKLSGMPMEKTKEIIKFMFVKVPAKVKLLTMGEKGAFHIADKKLTHVSSIKVPIENTVGAGDAFGSAFLYGTIKQLGVMESLRWGIKNSTSVIQKPGAKEGFLEDYDTILNPVVKSM